jgi:TRAP-type C4-dicarboxylate transport system substrate-binding protein
MVLLSAAATAAPKTINLTAIDGYPPKSLWIRTFVEYFIPEVDRQLAAKGNYKIRWNQAWGGQIVKPRHVLEGLQKGLGDIGIVTSVFHHDKVPLQAVAYVTPFVTTDPALLARTIDELVEKFPAYRQAWARYNQVYLTNLAVLDTYQMFFKEPVKDLKGFAGKKVGSAGINLRYLQNTGAAGVPNSAVNYYNMIKTGTIDSSMLWAEGAITFKLVEVAPYMLKADIGTANSKAITMNADTWKRLPEEVRDVIRTAAIGYRDYTEKRVIELSKTAYGAFTKRGGKIIEMSADERKRWAATMPNVAKDWASDWEKKGLPAKAILGYYMDRMRAANQPILRHWDKE